MTYSLLLVLMALLTRGADGNLYTGDATSLQAQNRKFWAQLTDYDGSKWYAWTEVQPTYGGTFVELPGGRSGKITPTVVYPAFCAEQTVQVTIFTSVIGATNGTYVEMQRAYFDAGSTTLQWVWVFWWPGEGNGGGGSGSGSCREYRYRCLSGNVVQEQSDDCGASWSNATYVAGPFETSTCFAGKWMVVRSSDCGVTYDEIVEDSNMSCGPTVPCRTIFPPERIAEIAGCINGLVYQYVRTVQDFYDAMGCLHRFRGPQVLTPTNICCTVCHDSGSGTFPSGSGLGCGGVQCSLCSTSTPCEFAFNLTCPDFSGGSGSGGGPCLSCNPTTPTVWTFVGSGFTGDFAAFNVTIVIPWGGVGELPTCYWYVLGDVSGVSAQVSVFSSGGDTQVDLQLLAPDGVTHIRYVLTLAETDIDCCVARTLDVDPGDVGGTGTYPATVVVTPTCGDSPVCTPNPSGPWTLVQLASQPCTWYQAKAGGVEAALYLLYDSVEHSFQLQLIITSATYTFVFTYTTLPFSQTSFDCAVSRDLLLVHSDGCVCSSDPLSLTVTPVMEAAACCDDQGSGSGGGTVSCAGCPTRGLPATLYARFSGSMAAYGCLTISYNLTNWSSTVPMVCGVGGMWTFTCLPDGTFVIGGGATNGKTGLIPTSCNPFSLTAFDVAAPGTSCPGDPYQVTISETPC